MRRVDRQPLEKSLLGVASAQGIRAHGFASGAGTEAGSCRAYLADSAWFQAPLLCERGDVDLASGSVLARDQSLCLATQSSLGDCRMTRIGVFEQHQLLDGVEPGRLGTHTRGDRECRGAHGGVAELRQPVGPVQEVGKRREPLLVVEHQLSGLWLE